MSGGIRPRVRSADPEGAELADVAIAALILLGRLEESPEVARYWQRVRIGIEARPVADLQVAIEAAIGLKDLANLFPPLADDLREVAARIEARAWERELR